MLDPFGETPPDTRRTDDREFVPLDAVSIGSLHTSTCVREASRRDASLRRFRAHGFRAGLALGESDELEEVVMPVVDIAVGH